MELPPVIRGPATTAAAALVTVLTLHNVIIDVHFLTVSVRLMCIISWSWSRAVTSEPIRDCLVGSLTVNGWPASHVPA